MSVPTCSPGDPIRPSPTVPHSRERHGDEPGIAAVARADFPAGLRGLRPARLSAPCWLRQSPGGRAHRLSQRLDAPGPPVQLDVIIPACQQLNQAARRKGVPVSFSTTAYDATEGAKPPDMGLWVYKIPGDAGRRQPRGGDRQPDRPRGRHVAHHQEAGERVPRHVSAAVPHHQPDRHGHRHRCDRGRVRAPR
jgi:hypothetical protein